MQSSSSFFNDSLINIIADEIKDAVRNIIKSGIMKEQGVGTLGGRCESLPTKDTLQVVSLNSLAFEYKYIILHMKGRIITS